MSNIIHNMMHLIYLDKIKEYIFFRCYEIIKEGAELQIVFPSHIIYKSKIIKIIKD